MMQYRIINERTRQAVAESARLADSPWARMRGLLGRKGLAPGEAIILRPGSSIHTLFMRFSLDVIFADREGKVVKVSRDVKPFRLVMGLGARDVIEMEAGALNGVNLAVGDRLTFEALPS